MMGPGMIPEIDPADEQVFVAGVSDNIHGAGVIAYPTSLRMQLKAWW